jgi:DNA-binding transcriptional regulator YdaS (Cro superfamily)
LTRYISVAILRVEMKKIRAYLDKNSLSQEAFGNLIGVSQGLVWQWMNGHTQITAERAIEIEEKTKGAIKRHELRPDLYAKAKAA